MSLQWLLPKGRRPPGCLVRLFPGYFCCCLHSTRDCVATCIRIQHRCAMWSGSTLWFVLGLPWPVSCVNLCSEPCEVVAHLCRLYPRMGRRYGVYCIFALKIFHGSKDLKPQRRQQQRRQQQRPPFFSRQLLLPFPISFQTIIKNYARLLPSRILASIVAHQGRAQSRRKCPHLYDASGRSVTRIIFPSI